MANQHPITPPPELLQLWKEQHYGCSKGFNELLTEVAQWGADQELEACCEWLIGWDTCEGERLASLLHEGRRPKPPSLKEQALQVLSEAIKMADDVPPEGICSGQADIIRRALEQLDD